MASPASTSAPVSLSLLLPPSPYLRLPAPFSRLPPRRFSLAPARPAAALLSSPSHAQHEHEDVEEEEGDEYEEELVEEDGMVEVGYISGAHGVRGDVLVSPRTDFPELRFATVLPLPPSLPLHPAPARSVWLV